MYKFLKNPFVYIPLLILSGPIISNLIVWLPIPSVSDNTTWLGFYGNYSGGIIGGVVAYLITRYQLVAEKEKDIENNRSFITAENISAPIKLKDVSTNENSKIIVNDNYNELLDKFGHNESVVIPFLKVKHFGVPDAILDCYFHIVMEDESGTFAYEITSRIGVIEKDVEIYLPLSKIDYKKVLIKAVEIKYTTLKGERIIYKGSFKENKGCFLLQLTDGSYKELFNFDIKNSKWIFPSKLRKNE